MSPLIDGGLLRELSYSEHASQNLCIEAGDEAAVSSRKIHTRSLELELRKNALADMDKIYRTFSTKCKGISSIDSGEYNRGLLS